MKDITTIVSKDWRRDSMLLNIKKLKLQNVKMFDSLEWDFETNPQIRGLNGSGKTTILEAALFMLTNKDINDKKYDMTSVKHDGNAFIELTIEINSVEYVLKKNATKWYIGAVGMTRDNYFKELTKMLGHPDIAILINPMQALYNKKKDWEEIRANIVKSFGNVDAAQLDELVNALPYGDDIIEKAKAIGWNRKVAQENVNLAKKQVAQAETSLQAITMAAANSVKMDTSPLENEIKDLELQLESYQPEIEAETLLRKENDEINAVNASVQVKIQAQEDKAKTIAKTIDKITKQESCFACGQIIKMEPKDFENLMHEYTAIKNTIEELSVEKRILNYIPMTTTSAVNNLNTQLATKKNMLAVMKKQNNSTNTNINPIQATDKLSEARQEFTMWDNVKEVCIERERAIANISEVNVSNAFPGLDVKLSRVIESSNTIKPCLEFYHEGVDMNSVNTAKRIQIGITLAQNLQDREGITAPIFIDGIESMTEVISNRVILSTFASKDNTNID